MVCMQCGGVYGVCSVRAGGVVCTYNVCGMSGVYGVCVRDSGVCVV